MIESLEKRNERTNQKATWALYLFTPDTIHVQYSEIKSEKSLTIPWKNTYRIRLSSLSLVLKTSGNDYAAAHWNLWTDLTLPISFKRCKDNNILGLPYPRKLFTLTIPVKYCGDRNFIYLYLIFVAEDANCGGTRIPNLVKNKLQCSFRWIAHRMNQQQPHVPNTSKNHAEEGSGQR